MDVKTYYWTKVRNLTIIWLFLWIIIAIVLPALSPYLWKGLRVAGLPVMHMYMNAMIVIVIGVALIFIYAALMNKLDRDLKEKVAKEELE